MLVITPRTKSTPFFPTTKPIYIAIALPALNRTKTMKNDNLINPLGIYDTPNCIELNALAWCCINRNAIT